jgi:hypothetical protein
VSVLSRWWTAVSVLLWRTGTCERLSKSAHASSLTEDRSCSGAVAGRILGEVGHHNRHTVAVAGRRSPRCCDTAVLGKTWRAKLCTSCSRVGGEAEQ